MAREITVVFLFCVSFALISFPDMTVSAAKDRFNIYKDLLRPKTEVEDLSGLIDDDRDAKYSYFYRIPPVGLNAGLRVGPSPTDLGKRTINRFKNYMLGKENNEEEVRKRGNTQLFGWDMTNRNNFDHEFDTFGSNERTAPYMKK